MPRSPMITPHRTFAGDSRARLGAAEHPRPRRFMPLVAALAAILLLASAAPAAALSTEYNFTITGHGWGHGIGLSQWGAYGYAKHGWEFKAILKHYYTGISFDDVADVPVRVQLRNGLSAVKVSCARDYTVQGTGAATTIPGGTTATTTYSGGHYHVVAGTLRHDFSSAVTFTPTRGSLQVLTATDLGDTGAYRGVLKVVQGGGGLMMINRVPLESYLRGVVPHEVSPSWPAEALKTQAAAARAYALASLNPSQTWDVYCDVRDQAYVGVGIEDSRTDAAVRGTAGIVPSYGGKPIMAFYFSCSGGHTENIELAWSGATSVPYLKGVEDPYDTYASLHSWGPLQRTPSSIGSALGASGSLRAVYTVKRGTSPRIVKAAVIASGSTKFVDGGTLRMKLNLNSSWAEITSMGISPSPRDKIAIAPGSSVTLSGRIYPALASGTRVFLRSFYDGAWHKQGVVTQRASEALPSGYTARYSTYSVAVSPSVTTQYYFSSDTAKSPTTTIKVK